MHERIKQLNKNIPTNQQVDCVNHICCYWRGWGKDNDRVESLHKGMGEGIVKKDYLDGSQTRSSVLPPIQRFVKSLSTKGSGGGMEKEKEKEEIQIMLSV